MDTLSTQERYTVQKGIHSTQERYRYTKGIHTIQYTRIIYSTQEGFILHSTVHKIATQYTRGLHSTQNSYTVNKIATQYTR